MDGLGGGFVIGQPVICNFGTPQQQATVGKECFLGNKRICLAISEAFAGSDVANIKTTAKKTADGKHYIVNGTKKWITSGYFADYFVTAVRTGGKGHGGISLLLIERSAGVNTEKIKTSYSSSAGTAFITFDDVKVPVENLLHKENKGFEAIMYNCACLFHQITSHSVPFTLLCIFSDARSTCTLVGALPIRQSNTS